MRFLIISLVVLFSLNAKATNYYFSSSTGSDNRSATEAQNAATPWKSIEKLNISFALFQPGDNIFFKRGDVFYGTIIIGKSGNASNPITLSAYGTGTKPVISGFSKLVGWQQIGNNIFEAQLSQLTSSENMLLISGEAKQIGRYPNADANNGGYLQFETASGNTSITDSKISGFNFNGGEIVIRKTGGCSIETRSALTLEVQLTIPRNQATRQMQVMAILYKTIPLL